MGRECESVFRSVLIAVRLIQQWRGSLLSVMFGGEAEDSMPWTIRAGLNPLCLPCKPAYWLSGSAVCARRATATGGRDCRHAAGHFSLEEGLRFAAERGALMGGLPTEGKQAGGMLAVFADKGWYSVGPKAFSLPPKTARIWWYRAC